MMLLLTLLFLGFAVWAFNVFVNIDARFKTVIIGLVCLYAFLLILQAFGFVHGIPSLR